MLYLTFYDIKDFISNKRCQSFLEKNLKYLIYPPPTCDKLKTYESCFMEDFMKNSIKISLMLLSITTLLQSDNSKIAWLTEEINKYNAKLSANTTLSDKKVTLEMPDCAEPTYVYLRNNNQHQRVLLTATKNTETISLIQSPNLSIFIIPAKIVESYISCREENIKLLTKESQKDAESNMEDVRPTVKEAKEEFAKGALQECGNIQQILVTNISTKDTKKHIILPTYQEVFKFKKDQTTKNKEYQTAHPYHGETMEFYIPEQTLKFSIKK
jgi:hypothetical protein